MGIVAGLVVLIVVLVVLLYFLSSDVQDRRSHSGDAEIISKRMMSANEINLYEKLKEFLPNYTIFSQVAFSAFMTSKDYSARSTFNRKFADFAILDSNYEIICLVELDDNSHRNKKDKDKNRDDLCMSVGYPVVRFPSQPNMNQIQQRLGHLVIKSDKAVSKE